MFTKSAAYYDALYHFKNYQQACEQLHQLIKQNSPKAKTLLDVACGTGKHLEYLHEHYETSGLDLDLNLLEIAQKRCVESKFYNADMTNFSLPCKFDVVVCLFSSIGYVQTVQNLNKAVACMVQHLNFRGMIVVEPWIYPEKYWKDKVIANFVDEPELKIAWMYKSQQEGLTSLFDIHYMVGTPLGVENFKERHIMGLWTDTEYRQAFSNVGVTVNYDSTGLFGRGMYFGIKQ